MRFSRLFSRTLREQQRDADTKSYDLLLRAGYVRPLSSGIYSYLHFGLRSMKKIEQILREEMDRIGGDEICMPLVHPAEIWKKTNRWYDIDESLLRFKDRTEKEMVLGMTHEEVVAELTKNEITSYKQLPKLVYQIQTKYRDEARARGGLIRVREFTMKDAYSLDTSIDGLKKQYIAVYNAYFRIFARTGLPVIAIQSDTGMMGGKTAHEFMYINPVGEDTIFICKESGYKANKDVACIRKVVVNELSKPLPLEKIYTPNCKTIDELSSFLGKEKSQFAKVVFYTGLVGNENKIILAIVRGDMDVNPVKVQNIVKAKTLKHSSVEEIKSINSVAGYASPIGIDSKNAIVVVDDLIPKSNNLVIGANEEDYHLINACFNRDFKADIIADIVEAFDGALCPVSVSQNNRLESVRGIEVGNIFQLGTKYTEALNAYYTDENGKQQAVVMGSYGIGVGRLLACIVEEHNDVKGMNLPITVAPYHVILIVIPDNQEIISIADSLYDSLKESNIEVIYDDRDKKSATVGEKFIDAELIGIPIRITISKRSIKNGGAEIKLRNKEESRTVSIEQTILRIKELINEQFAEINFSLDAVQKWNVGD